MIHEASYDYHFQNRSLVSFHQYDKRGFLVESSSVGNCDDCIKSLNYNYDVDGLINSFSIEGVDQGLSRTDSSWSTGGVEYKLDSLGRVVQKGSKKFEYGHNGRIKTVYENDEAIATYFYDEDDNTLFKIKNDLEMEFYFEDSIFTNGNYYLPIKGNLDNEIIVGYYKNNNFVKTYVNHLNSYIISDSGRFSIPIPKGLGTTSRQDASYGQSSQSMERYD